VDAGEQLRALRESLGLSIRMVEAASGRIAAKYENPDYLISLSRLSDIETKGITPNVYRIYSLSIVYHVEYGDILRMFGLDLRNVPADLEFASIPVTHITNALETQQDAEIPFRMDPGFHEASTAPIMRMIQRWGTTPLPFLKKFTDRKFTYGYVGREDWTMYPLLMPGTFIQIDESKRKVEEGPWGSEYERPIYFVETRESFVCCWCEMIGSMLTLKSHPQSAVKTRLVKTGSDAEIIGQVVGIAMRLDERSGSGRQTIE
jgi:transcriptional regulator with XRE-family HTH domain